jgi:hypothetical protein
MSVLKTTKHILNAPFEPINNNISANFIHSGLEDPIDDNVPVIDDIVYWQQIYYQPGLIGVYIAHQPKHEFYLIVYNMFVHEPKGVETFFGEDAVLNLLSRCRELGVHLPIDIEWEDNLTKS